MVQSPFRYRKPKNRNNRPPLPFSNGPNQNKTTTWIGGDSFIGEASSSLAETFQSFLNLNPAAAAVDSGDDSSNDVEAARGDDEVESTSSIPTEDENDVRRGPWSLSTSDQADNNRRIRSNMKYTSPKRDEEGEDEFYSPCHSNVPPIPPPRSFSIGGKMLFGETSLTSGSHHCRGSITSLEAPIRASTMSSIDCDTVNDLGGIESQEVMDLEAANSTSCDDEDENDATNNHTGSNRHKQPTQTNRKTATATCDIHIGSKRNSAMARHATPLREVRGDTVMGGNYRHNPAVVKRRRLSKRARTRLTMREVNSHIQPGRHYNSLESTGRFEKRKTITLPKTIDFFRGVETKLIAINVLISLLLTAFVLACPTSWQRGLADSSLAVSILGAFLSFALVFRTQACYARWWEARTQWGRMTSACINLSGQARAWFENEDLVDKFLTQCIVFPYACKAVLRGNPLDDSLEEGPRFLHSGMLMDADLGTIVRHGRPPFVCLEIMRRTMCEAFRENNNDRRCHQQLPSAMLNGAFLAMEQVLWELNQNFGSCLKINSTRMPASYTIFMRSFVIFFFMLASLSWAPTIKWLTPIITGFMVFLINTVIVIGDQMMRPFELQWAGLPLQKFCVTIEHEIMNVSRRHADINCLFSA
mmetsp:Transcript_13006/g.23474  ORF Transcript_13006/g.23474 Transcript_13006/m.23474 type:complete len:645 (-) Transcript_13006:4-1938(-)